MKSVTLLLVVMMGVLALPARVTAEAPDLPVLARVGPWPAISQVIGYGGRLWFANSVKGRNHNSADLYSLDPATADLRYERHLFSQDAGRPLVHRGLLYWPFEDPRFSQGWGHFQVTDGTGWRFGTVPTAQIFHIHALAERGDRLLAASSAWRAGLQASGDGGITWEEIYDHPTAARRVSRIVELVALADQLFAHLSQRGETRLLRLQGNDVSEVPGWPRGQLILGLTAFGGAVYGLVREAEGTALWRSDGIASRRLALPAGRWRGLTATAEGLWAVTAEESGGLLWRSPDGSTWQAHRRLSGGAPLEVTAIGDAVYVSGAGSDGRGILWGDADAIPAALARPDLPQPAVGETPPDWAAVAEELDRALADPHSYSHHGGRLRDLVYRAALAGPPPGFFESRLKADLPREELELIGGAVRVPAARLGRWILLWGLGTSGAGRVPVALVGAPWHAPENRSEKYFEPAPIAIWAAAQVGQKDRETLTALIERLDRAGDPDWLRGDVVGALSVLTGRRFGYDLAAWQTWWKGAAGDYSN